MGTIKDIHSENGNWSSKRVYGGILILTVCALAIFNKAPTIINELLYMGVSLIGLGTVPAILKAAKAKPESNEKSENS